MNWLAGTSTTSAQKATAASTSADSWIDTLNDSLSGPITRRGSQARNSLIIPGSEFSNITLGLADQGLLLAPSAQYATTPATNNSDSASSCIWLSAVLLVCS